MQYSTVHSISTVASTVSTRIVSCKSVQVYNYKISVKTQISFNYINIQYHSTVVLLPHTVYSIFYCVVLYPARVNFYVLSVNKQQTCNVGERKCVFHKNIII